MRRARAMSRRGVWFFVSLVVGLAALAGEGCHAHVQAEPALFKAAPFSPIAVGTQPLDIALADLNMGGTTSSLGTYGLKQLGCSTALHQTKVTEENNEASTRNES